MNTSNLVFKKQVQNHIKNRLDGIVWCDESSVKEDLEDHVKAFHDWYKYNPTINKQEAHKQYLMCLPGIINVYHTHFDIRNELRKWFESCGMEYRFNKQPEPEKEADLYYNLIYRELRNLCKQYEIEI